MSFQNNPHILFWAVCNLVLNFFETPLNTAIPKKLQHNQSVTALMHQPTFFEFQYLMPSSHCTILARFLTHRQVLINRRQMPDIGGKSALVHVSDNRQVWMIKDTIWGNRRCVADTREKLGMLNIWKNTSAMTYSQWESKIQGSGKFREDFILYSFFFKAIRYLQKTCIHFWH